MKTLFVSKVLAEGIPAEGVPALLDAHGVEFQPIDQVNWQDYPYRPRVEFRMAHTGGSILLHFRVTEASVRAVAAEDNGRVWEDACVEFFVQTDERQPLYYNIECNCAGTLLIGHGVRGQRTHGSREVMESVRRWASLGQSPFEERKGECSWELVEVIPVSALFADRVDSLDGKVWKANFYKCGDLLQTPHFLSWNPIDLPGPCFHCPDFFGQITFEGSEGKPA